MPDSDITGAVGVVVDGVGVTAGLMGNDALAAGLIPGVFSAPGGDVNHTLSVATIAGGAFS